jgi:hypothetical protein
MNIIIEIAKMQGPVLQGTHTHFFVLCGALLFCCFYAVGFTDYSEKS